jgi:hypothetical protein
MAEGTCALVSYLPGELGRFIDSLRGRFDPALAGWLAHVSILPPRPLDQPLETPLVTLQEKCALVEPFDVTIDAVSTFWPVSGVVYLSIGAGAERLVRLHEDLNSGSLAYREPHPYVPHITVAQELNEHATQSVMDDVEREWSRHGRGRSFRVESLYLVQKTLQNLWIDLVPIPLGSRLAPSPQ